MNVLVFLPYIPYPIDRGTYQRCFHLLRTLAAHHTVDLLAMTENGERMEHAPIFEAFCRRVKFVSFQHPAWPKLASRLFESTPSSVLHWKTPQTAAALDEMIGSGDYAFVHVCDIVLAQYFLGKHRHVPIALDRSRVDLQFQCAQAARMTNGLKNRLLAWEGIAKMWAYEKQMARRASLEVVCGPDDEVFLRRHVSRRASIKVIANGVDLDYFHSSAAPDPRAEEPTLIFCGAMDYVPNVDALRWFFGEMHARLLREIPNLKVLLVGKAPPLEVQQYAELPGVTVTGGVPDVRPYYRRAWLQIVPLRIGGGTRLKIVESMAIGTPVVSTTIGAQGLDLIHDQDILLADTPECFVRETVRALRDEALRGRIGAQAKETATSRLSWPRLGRELSLSYSQIFQQQHNSIQRPDSHVLQSTSPLDTADLPSGRAL